MQAHADSLAFTPPAEPAALRGFVLAVIAHALLVAGLTWGINWDKDTAPETVEAELWSALPQEAAPPPPRPAPQQRAVQPPLPAVQPPPPQPAPKEPDIALEREKQRKEQEARRRAEEEAEKRRLADAERREAEQRKQAEAERRRQEQQQKLAEEKKQREEEARKEKLRKEAEDKRLAEFREKNLERMMAKAAGAGLPSSQGTAAKSSGPSDSYAGRIRARVKPNIVFTDDTRENPSAEVEVRMAPDGTIVSRKVTKSSGVKAWDDAVLRALDRTEVLPRDVDGRVHTPLIIEFKLRG